MSKIQEIIGINVLGQASSIKRNEGGNFNLRERVK